MCIALASLAGLLLASDPIAAKFAKEDWNSDGLYEAIFGWSAIQTGFAFGVYGFVLGKGDGFIAALKQTAAMGRFIGYIKRANYSGFALTFVSIPLIVFDPAIESPYSIEYAVVAAWFSLFLWSFLAFLRLAYNFGKIASVPDKKFLGA